MRTNTTIKSGLLALAACFGITPADAALSYSTGFEPGEGFSLGQLSPDINSAQGGWSGGAQGGFTNNDTGDEEIVASPVHSGTQSWHYARGYGSPGQGTPYGPVVGNGTFNDGDQFIASLWFKAASETPDGQTIKITTGTANGGDRGNYVAYLENTAAEGIHIYSFKDGAAFNQIDLYTGVSTTAWHKLDFKLTKSGFVDHVTVSLDGGVPIAFNAALNEWRQSLGYAYADHSRLKFYAALDGDTAYQGFYFDDISYEVAPNYPVKNITQNTGSSTIQAAIDAAAAGDTIQVYPGNYDEMASGRGTTTDTGPYQFGLFLPPSKPGLTIQGLKADGTPVTTAADVAATVTTNATNDFGFSGIFVAAANVTIQGLNIGNNAAGNDKTIEVIADNFTFTASKMSATNGDLYFGDYAYDDHGTPTDFSDDRSAIQSYAITGNIFSGGSGIYIGNGAGWTGSTPAAVTGRSITGNRIDDSGTLAFAGPSPGVGWLLYPVGAATVTGNTWTGPNTRYVQAWGTTQAVFPFGAYFSNNTYPASVITTTDGNPNHVRGYDIAPSYINLLRIGTVIQARIDNAQSGDTVLVGPGTYNENVTISKSLTLKGAQAGVDARGRTGSESIIPAQAGGSSAISIAANNVTIDGFAIQGAGTAGGQTWGINAAAGTATSGTHITNTIFQNLFEGLHVQGPAGNVSSHMTVDQNAFFDAPGDAFAKDAGIWMASAPSDHLTIANNSFSGHDRGDGGNYAAINIDFSTVLSITGNTSHNDGSFLVLVNNTNVTVSGNTSGNSGTGFNQSSSIFLDLGNNGVMIQNNSLDNGLRGVRFANFYGTGTTQNVQVLNNTITHMVNFGILVPAGTVSDSVLVHGNQIVGNAVGVSNDIANPPVDATLNWWGAASGPGGVAPGSGDQISANVLYNPWYADAACTILRNGIVTNTTITTPQANVPNLYVAPNTTVTVTPTGGLSATALDMAPGAALVVNGGKLDLGQGSVISGTFTVFNSFGSWDINGDTTFNIGQNLALISDIHVAAGATVTVNGGGELILDGCIINSQTPGTKYNLTAATDGLLTVARSVVTDANIDLNTLAASVPANLRSRVFDSSFTTSDIEASAASQVYHNLFDAATNSAANTDATAAFAAVDGWANVTSASALQNKFTLDFVAPTASGRTLDANGNLFVQPNDAVVMKMDVAALGANRITAAEALLGYNSVMLAPVSSQRVTPLGTWEVIAETDPVSPISGYGLVDSALGLQLNAGQEGINTDQQIANVSFTAGSPGVTVGFFRVQTDRVFNPDGTLVQDTRLTKSALGVPSFLTAFTANTGELVIDNQPPTIAAASVNATQVQANSASPVDVLDPTPTVSPNYVFRNGNPVILTFTATDAGLAGLDAADATADLALTASNGTTTLAYTVTAAEVADVVTYTVTLNVPATATTGTYAVSATVRDRSGNVSVPAALGSFQIANEVLASVELEGYVGGTRAVVFTATGGVLKTWTKNVVFTGALGSVPLEAVPAGTTAISAKAAWNLRRRLSVPFSPVGVGAVSLTGANLLRGGDLNGDNVVNTLDYSILRYHWLTADTVADITGNAAVNTADYELLRGNFYTVGDPQ